MLKHNYGENIHILDNTHLWSLLAQFSSPQIKQPLLNHYVEEMYSVLLSQVVNQSFPKVKTSINTRMKALTDKAVISGEIINPDQAVVIINLARAGSLPSHYSFEKLHLFLNSEKLRQDHFYINRKVDSKERVVGVDVSGSKIGGDIENAIVLLPDPMGATGGSISHVVDHYKNNVPGKALKFVAVHLIITPEYIQKLQATHPDVEIFAARLDRGLSDEIVLSSIPGTYPDQEKGLNDNHYIVPGAGGVGEILNNSFV